MVYSTRYHLFFISFITLLFFAFISDSWAASNNKKNKRAAGYTPPPIPTVNTKEFKSFVQQYHTFPSPFGFEPYRDDGGNAIAINLNAVNPILPYIPVTFYCNSMTKCPRYILTAADQVMFAYPNKDNGYMQLGVKQKDANNTVMIGFYYPNDPNLHRGPITYKDLGYVKRGDPLVTILFSQRALQRMSDIKNGILNGTLTANEKVINAPTSDGLETLTPGTTLGVIGLGVASGVEFSETVTQTTGESFTHQVQTGFSLSVSIENTVSVGGGVVPVSDSFKVGINETLSQMVSNGVEISNQQSTSRTYTIKPGINDTYYWAIYQLLYSYRLNAPLLESALGNVQTVWESNITFNVAGNQRTQDGQYIGNLLPPQRSSMVGDVTVGVAVPVNPQKSTKFHVQTLRS